MRKHRSCKRALAFYNRYIAHLRHLLLYIFVSAVRTAQNPSSDRCNSKRRQSYTAKYSVTVTQVSLGSSTYSNNFARALTHCVWLNRKNIPSFSYKNARLTSFLSPAFRVVSYLTPFFLSIKRRICFIFNCQGSRYTTVRQKLFFTFFLLNLF